MAYKTNYIDVNKPAKVLSLSVTSINGEAQWPHNDGDRDKWYVVVLTQVIVRKLLLQ